MNILEQWKFTDKQKKNLTPAMIEHADAIVAFLEANPDVVEMYEKWIRMPKEEQEKLRVQKHREEASKAAKSSNGNNTANSKAANKSAVVAKPNNATKKLNFNDQRELDALPEEIASLEAEQLQLEEKLADGSWFTKDMEAATAASERLLLIEDEMMTKLERWHTLER